MRWNRSVRLLVVLTLYILGMNCECDSGGGVEQAAPKVESHHVGDTETTPTADQYTATAENGEITVDFGPVDIETQEHKYLFLRNTGLSELKVFSGQMEEGSSSDYVVACRTTGIFQTCPSATDAALIVPAGSDLVLQLTYQPMDKGTDQGRFIVQSNASDHGTLVIDIQGEGVTPQIQVCYTDCEGDQDGADCTGAAEVCSDQLAAEDLYMAFGSADMATAVRRHVTITNLGEWPLQISGLNFANGDFNQFQLDKNDQDLPGILEATQSAEIFLVYDPGTGGDHSCDFLVISNDVNDKEIRIRLSGQGLAPRVCPDPLLVDFGNVPTGESLVKSFSVTNCGLLDLNFENVQMNGDSSGDFSLVNIPGFPVVLTPGQAQAVEVEYHPSDKGSDHGGVDLYSDDPASHPTSHLTGTVTLQGTSYPRACDIQAVPPGVQFGGVIEGGSQTYDLVIANQGNDTCTLNDVQITQNSADNEFAIIEAPAPNTDFEPGDTLPVRLSYMPTALGIDTGVLTIFGNDNDQAEIPVELNGQGVDDSACDLEVDPTRLTFLGKVNTSQKLSVLLRNRGQQPCTVSDLELVQSLVQPGDLSLSSAPAAPFTVPGQGSVQLEVTFAPTRPGEHWSYLRFTTDDPDLRVGLFCIPPPVYGQACITIRGEAVEATIAAVPAELDFGLVTVGCASPELKVTLYNLGGIELNVSDIYLEHPAGPYQIRQAPVLPHIIPPGASVELRLRYVPITKAVHPSTLFIASDASNDPLLAIPLHGEGTDTFAQIDLFSQPDRVKSDVMFVVDNSGSMSDKQDALAGNFDAFIRHATTLDVDFQIGVVTTEVNDSDSNVGTPARDIEPGVLVNAPGRPKILTNSTPDLINAFKDNVTVGPCCSD